MNNPMEEENLISAIVKIGKREHNVLIVRYRNTDNKTLVQFADQTRQWVDEKYMFARES